MERTWIICGGMLLASLFFSLAAAEAGHGHHAGCCVCGEKVCCPEIKEGKETKTCWKVECEEVCIPPVRFPWERCCPIQCGGHVRSVAKLKVEEYECDTWSVKWKPVCVACRQQLLRHRQHGSGNACACDACAKAEAAGVTLVQLLTEAEQETVAGEVDNGVAAGHAPLHIAPVTLEAREAPTFVAQAAEGLVE